MSLNLSEFKRFEKQIILKKIGISGQKKLQESKVLIIGMGGLGCPLLAYLASAGIHNIGIIDHDKVELSNLNRQILFDTADLGKYKAIQAKSKINKIYKKIQIKSFNQKVSTANIKNISKDYDIICDGTDNFNTRYLINDYCKKNKKILISAAISRFDGQLFKFNFKKKGPCFRCFMPEQPLEDNNCETDGIFAPVAGIMGTLQANEVLKTVLGLKEDLNNNILVFNSLSMSLRKIKLNKNLKCLNRCH